MAVILDQSRDQNGQKLYALLHIVGPDGVKLFDVPDYVKSAGDEKITGNDKTSPTVYGDPRQRLFPCHTAEATWVSSLFFHSQKQAMSRQTAQAVEKRIDAAARHHGVSLAIEAVKEAFSKTSIRTEAELPDSDFALVIAWDGGDKERRLPIRNENEVKAACDYLRRYQRELSFDNRRTVAEKILSKAAAMNIDLGPETEILEKQAGHGTCSPEKIAEYLFSRARAIKLLKKDFDMAEKLAGFAVRCLENPDFSTVPSNLHRIASFVEKVDNDYDLKNLTTLPRAEDSLFNLNGKVAEQILGDHVALTSGMWYTRSKLAGVGLSTIQDAMGEDFAKAVTNDGLFVDLEKLAEIAPTLPRADAKLFDSMMASLNIEPAHKEAGASGPLTDRDALFELANLHAVGG